MFQRLLALPAEVRARYDVSSLKRVLHGAAPCPPDVKRAMIDWLGPILQEYYSGTEGGGNFTMSSEEWLKRPGSVGAKPATADVKILDEAGALCPTGVPGQIYFRRSSDNPFVYYKDDTKTEDAHRGDYFTLGDVGYFDEEHYLFLTGRTADCIISGGVNIYPQECENLLITHPKVADAAVFGVPNQDLGEEVKAAIQLMPGIAPGPDITAELLAFCGEHLARQKCPRSIDFEAELPRLPTGKLYKRLLRDRYWQGHKTRIV
jgi:long-chain acyl-CoA synthetase